MSLTVAIILGIIFIPVYAYVWTSILRSRVNKRSKQNNSEPMTKIQFRFLLVLYAVLATCLIFSTIYFIYFT